MEHGTNHNNYLPYTVDFSKEKVLIDGDRVVGTGERVYEVTDAGIILHLVVSSPVLKHFDPKKFMAILSGDDATMITQMDIKKAMLLPYKSGQVNVDVMLYGSPSTDFMD